MKALVAAVFLFVSVPALACKMTPLGYDAYRISEAAKYFSENTSISQQAHVSKIRINKDNLVVVESTQNGQCFVSGFAVFLNADCSSRVALVKTMEACE